MSGKFILMIGKPNDIFRDLHDYLDRFFNTQVCTDDPAAIEGTLKLLKPNLILVSLIGVGGMDPKVFSILETKCQKIPIITIGTQHEWETVLSHYDPGHFHNLTRPIDNIDVFCEIKEQLDRQEETGKAKVLVVDDDGGALRMMRVMLGSRYDVTLASSGTRAVTSIGRERPDVIILDYEMPVIDGKKTLEMIRSEEDLKEIPVIFLTSVHDRAHVQAVKDLGCSGHVLKPPTREGMIQVIEKAVSKSRNKGH